jgi:hypothetical protein
MSDQLISILSVEQDGGDGLIVVFSDGTTSGYAVEEMLELRPFRQALSNPKKTDLLRAALPPVATE